MYIFLVVLLSLMVCGCFWCGEFDVLGILWQGGECGGCVEARGFGFWCLGRLWIFVSCAGIDFFCFIVIFCHIFCCFVK